eukprot:TRINITY_DN3274_c0_g1_i1.p1 TRINITY_DN3274_c0_g1~~TRINITY_DN3274_c0_g1_i1.p1  ORF type:complete len:1920 (-),score=404.50 TRINITY_DN3274_c0_g1_i1:23-5338(-)
METPDPYFEIKSSGRIFYRSEVIHKSATPVWQPFVMNMKDVGGIDTPFTISVFDYDKDGGHDLLGIFHTTFREWTFGRFQEPIYHGSDVKGGFIIEDIVPVEEVLVEYHEAYEFRASGLKIANMDGIGNKSDPFFEVRCTPPGFDKEITLYRSEIVKDSSSPEWNPFILSQTDVGGLDTNFNVYIYDYDTDGGHDLIGSMTTTLRDWLFSWYSQGIYREGISAIGSQGAFCINHFEPGVKDYNDYEYAEAFLINAGAVKLANMDGIGNKSDPYFEIFGSPDELEENYRLVYRSEVIHEAKECDWNDFVINVSDVGGYDSFFVIVVKDRDKDGTDETIGRLYTTLRDLSFSWYLMKLRQGEVIIGTPGAYLINRFEPCAKKDYSIYDAYEIIPRGVKFTNTVKMENTNRKYFEVHVHKMLIYRSEYSEKLSSIEWEPFPINVSDTGHLDHEFKIKVYNFKRNGNHSKIGTFTTTLWECINHGYNAVRNSAGLSNGGFGTSANPCSVVDRSIPPAYEITPSGIKLANKDGPGGKSDPYFQVIVDDYELCRGKDVVIYRSDYQSNNSNPLWKPFVININEKGLDRNIKISVYDFDQDGGHDKIASMNTTLRDCIMRWHSKKLGTSMINGAWMCSDAVPANPIVNTAVAYQFSASGVKLDFKLKDAAKPTSSFFKISFKNDLNRDITLFRSEVCHNTTSPTWDPFVLNIRDFGDVLNNFTLSVYRYSGVGAHSCLGSVSGSIHEFSLSPWRYPIRRNFTLGDSQGAFAITNVQALDNEVPIGFNSNTLQVKVRCRKLDSKDLDGLSDPFFEIRYVPRGGSQEITFYRSEYIKDTLNPEFAPFLLPIDEFGGIDQNFKIRVYDFDGDGSHDLIGELRTTIREWMFGEYVLPVINKSRKNIVGYKCSGGFILDHIDEVDANLRIEYAPAYRVKVEGYKLAGTILESDEYITFFKITSINDTLLYRSELSVSKDPEWEPFVLNVSDIGGLDVAIEIGVYNFSSDGFHSLVGKFYTTIREWCLGPFTFALVHPKKKSVIGYQSSGGFKLLDIEGCEYTPSVTTPPNSLIMELEGKDIDLGFFDEAEKCDIFYEVISPNGKLYYRSERVEADKPIWAPMELSVGDFGIFTSFVVTVYRHSNRGHHRLIGSVDKVTLGALYFGDFRYKIVHHKKSARIGYKSSGCLLFNNIQHADTLTNCPALEEKFYRGTFIGYELDNAVENYFEISIPSPFDSSQSDVVLYRSEIYSGNSPEWVEFEFNMEYITLDSFINITIKNDVTIGSSKVGSVQTTVRDWLFGNYTHKVINRKSKKIIPKYKTSGGLTIVDFHSIDAPTIDYSIYEGLELRMCNFELTGVITGKYQNYFFEIWCNGPHPFMVHRSSENFGTDEPEWEPCSIYLYDILDARTELSLVLYKWVNKSKGQKNYIGQFSFTLPELLIGPFYGKLKNSNKMLPTEKRPGKINIEILSRIMNPPPYPATGYKVDCSILNTPLRSDGSGRPIISKLNVFGYPLDTDFEKTVIYDTRDSYETNFSFTLPFEAVGGLFYPIKWSYFDGSFKASLYELTLPDNCLVFQKKHSVKKNLKKGLKKAAKAKSIKKATKVGNDAFRLHAGILVIDSITPVNESIIAYDIQISAHDLLLPSHSSQYKDPYFIFKNISNALLYTSETHSMTETMGFNSARISVLDIGGMDQPLIIQVYAIEGGSGIETLVGETRPTLRELLMSFNKKAGEYFLVNFEIKKQRGKRYRNSGFVVINNMVAVHDSNYKEVPIVLEMMQHLEYQ